MESKFVITNIKWNRIFLEIKIKSDIKEDVNFNFFCYKTKKNIEIKYDEYKNNEYIFSLNLASIANNQFLENGKWRILALHEEEEHTCTVDIETAYELENLDKIFKYGKNDLYSYNISFSLAETENLNYVLIMHNFFMKKNQKWNKRLYLYEANKPKKIIKNLSKDFKILLMNLAYKILYMTNKHDKILFMSETKDYMWGNLKAVDDKIEERKLNLKIIYSFRKAVGVSKSNYSWFKTILKISKSHTIIVDDYVPIFNFLKLNKNVELVQLWHAGAGFKAVGYCRFGKNGSPFPVCSCHKNYTKAIVGSNQLIKVFEEVFGQQKENLYPYGMPRLDNFLDKDIIETTKKELYDEYEFLKNKKIILFAPTYRGVGQKTAYYDFQNFDFEKLYKVCKKKNYLFLIKLHPFITERVEIPDKYKEHIREFSEYKHINNLYYITDIMITDYSSSYYEFSLMEKPIVFFTYDRCEYELTRGVYQSIKESAPGKVCDTFKELLDTLDKEDFELEKTLEFSKSNFDTTFGKASDNIINNIILRNQDKK
ncbi:MAG: CDP-glycerol glycerophosphotransferase family protein [bacterium]